MQDFTIFGLARAVPPSGAWKTGAILKQLAGP